MFKLIIGDKLLDAYLPFMGLIIFGNIENLILSSQGVVQGVDPKVLGGLSILVVILWLIIDNKYVTFRTIILPCKDTIFLKNIQILWAVFCDCCFITSIAR